MNLKEVKKWLSENKYNQKNPLCLKSPQDVTLTIDMPGVLDFEYVTITQLWVKNNKVVGMTPDEEEIVFENHYYEDDLNYIDEHYHFPELPEIL